MSRRGSPQSGGDKSQTVDRRPLYPHTIGQLLSWAFQWYIGLGVYDQRISSNGSISVSVRASALSVTPGPTDPHNGHVMTPNMAEEHIIDVYTSITAKCCMGSSLIVLTADYISITDMSLW